MSTRWSLPSGWFQYHITRSSRSWDISAISSLYHGHILQSILTGKYIYMYMYIYIYIYIYIYNSDFSTFSWILLQGPDDGGMPNSFRMCLLMAVKIFREEQVCQCMINICLYVFDIGRTFTCFVVMLSVYLCQLLLTVFVEIYWSMWFSVSSMAAG